MSTTVKEQNFEEVLIKKQERYKQICDAIKTAIQEAKEAGEENENAFSCDVFFDEDGKVEGAEVTFTEYANMYIIYAKNTDKEAVNALYDQNYFTAKTNHDKEVEFAADAIFDLYEERLLQKAEEKEREEICKLYRKEAEIKEAEEEAEYKAIFC